MTWAVIVTATGFVVLLGVHTRPVRTLVRGWALDRVWARVGLQVSLGELSYL